MAFINKKFDKNKKKNRPEGDDKNPNKKKFDNKPPTSDENDDEDRGKSFQE